MPRKGQTTVDKDLMIVLKANKGYAIHFSNIYRDLVKRGICHYQGNISNNLKNLIAQGKIVKVEDKAHPSYGIPNTRKNGTKYIIVKGFGAKDTVIEV